MSSERGPLERGVLSGQCRVEAMTAGGSGLQLEGLRLSLDLRLPPGPVTGVEAPARAASPSARRGRWLVAGLGGVLLLGGGWWWHTGSPRSEAPSLPQRAPEPARQAAPPSAWRWAAPPEAAPASPLTGSSPPSPPSPSAAVAQRSAALPGERSAASAARAPAIRPIAPPQPAHASAEQTVQPQASTPGRRTGRGGAGASGGRLPPRATPTAGRDLLELFGDTK